MRIIEVGPGGAAWRDFTRVPWRLHYGRDPQWTPALPGEERAALDARNPSLDGVRFRCWVAGDGEHRLGRIAAFAPPSTGATGYIGFFEAADDEVVSGALFSAAEAWLRAQGRTDIYAPIDGNARDRIGLLTDGFDRPATVLTPYNPPYYARLLECAGYAPVIRLRSYGWHPALADPGGLLARERRVADRGRLRIRPLDRSRIEEEARTIVKLLNAAFATTWGYMPATAAEARARAHAMRRIVDPRLILFAENARGPVGVALTLPDVNWLARRMNGRWWPAGWLTALRWHRRIPWARFMALAVLPDRRAGGAALRLVIESHRALAVGGYTYAELAQVFDDNAPVRRIIERIRIPVVRRFAVFRRTLAGEAAHDAH